MSTIKVFGAFVCLSLLAANPVVANPYGRYHYHYRGYGAPFYPYAPVVVAPPPPPVVVVPPARPVYVYPPPPVYAAPAPVYAATAPVFVPPAYSYGVVGPRGHFGFGYATPGFGVYIGR